MKQESPYKASRSKLLLTLLLAVIHLLAGFSILMVSSWFIAACSIAGLGFNYMLPAVVIRALAIIRIASGYFSMLVGHHHLLGKLAALRLTIFASLHNKVSVSRSDSLDALHHQSEEVAAIWMAWVGQNAGAFLSLVLLNGLVAFLLPELSTWVLGFSVFFLALYAALLGSMVYKSAELVAARKTLQFAVMQHMEAAPLWHLYNDYSQQAPSTDSLQRIVDSLQARIRSASLLLFAGAMAVLCLSLAHYSQALAGNALVIIVPVALLSLNDWLAPTLGNQKQLLNYLLAKQAIKDTDTLVEGVAVLEGKIDAIAVSEFRTAHTAMPHIESHFKAQSTSVLMGSSGVGKSRFLQALCGLLPFEGQRDIGTGTKQGLLADSYYLEQFPYVLSDTLAENLRVANRNASDTQLLAVLKQVGLGHMQKLDQWLGEHGLPLSGGEKKRLGMARALLTDATVLLLDEPFESLDDANIERMVQGINKLAEAKLIVVATHILPDSLQHTQCLTLEKTNTPTPTADCSESTPHE